MSSNTADNGNEERGQDVPVSSNNNEEDKSIDGQADVPHSLPVKECNTIPSENGNPLSDTTTVPDFNHLESQPSLHQDLPASVPLGAVGGSAEGNIERPADARAETNQVPDTKTESQADNTISTSTEPPANPKAEPSSRAPERSNAISTSSKPPANPEAKPSSQALEVNNTIFTTMGRPSNPKPEPSYQAPEADNTISTTSKPPENEVKPSSQAPVANNTVSTSTKPPANPEAEPTSQAPEAKTEPATPKPNVASSDTKPKNANGTEHKHEVKTTELPTPNVNENSNLGHSFLLDENYEGSESGTEEEQSAFMKELENFFRERSMEFKPPKFYGEGLNCLKLWRAVTRLGGYDKVTSCKLWRQVGESFKPPKTCTTVSWTFRGFYEKALLDYERHKTCGGELSLPVASHPEPMNIDNQASGSGRTRRDAAARAMQGWHSQRVLGNGEVSDPIIKDKNAMSLQKREKQLKSLGLLKRKKPSYMEHAVKATRIKPSKPQVDVAVVDIGPPADWVKINVQRTKDCFEVYALVPGLLREEVRVQSDPAGRLVISGEPEHPDNPWGVTPFKKVVSLPGRIDPHQTSAVVTLHGQLFVRVPFEQSD